MDQAFLMRAQRLLDQRAPARLTHELLVVTVRRQQDDSVTARTQQRIAAGPGPSPAAALTALLLAAGGWRETSTRLSGCFDRAGAERLLNTR